jgi:hypothetical protein
MTLRDLLSKLKRRRRARVLFLKTQQQKMKTKMGNQEMKHWLSTSMMRMRAEVMMSRQKN